MATRTDQSGMPTEHINKLRVWYPSMRPVKGHGMGSGNIRVIVVDQTVAVVVQIVADLGRVRVAGRIRVIAVIVIRGVALRGVAVLNGIPRHA